MLTRIISGAVGVVILAVILFFHDTMVLPIAVAAIIAVMLYELLRAVNMHKCIPILCTVELCGIATPLIYNYYYYVKKSLGDQLEFVCEDGVMPLVSFTVTLV